MYVVIAGYENKLCAGRFLDLVINKRLCACSQKELETLYKCNIKGIDYEETIQQEDETTNEQSED